MKNICSLLLFSLATQIASLNAEELPMNTQQEIVSIYLDEMPPIYNHQMEQKGNSFGFISLGLDSGPGISIRNRQGNTGNATDFKVGMYPVKPASFTAAADYSLIGYLGSDETSSAYGSVGIGVFYTDSHNYFGRGIWPTMPCRFGIQFSHGFIDVGGRVIAIFPVPELRAGITF